MRLACVEGVSKKSTRCFAHPRRTPSRGKERKGNGCYAGYNEVERKVRDKWKLLTLNMRWTLFAQVFSLLKINSGHNYTFCEFLFSMSFSLDRGPAEQRTCAWHRGLKALWHFFGVKDLEDKYPPHFSEYLPESVIKWPLSTSLLSCNHFFSIPFCWVFVWSCITHCCHAQCMRSEKRPEVYH